MAFDPLDLSWLTSAPADFRKRLHELKVESPDCGELLLQLASHRVDFPQSGLFNRALGRLLKAANGSLPPLIPFRLTLVSNATVDLVADALPIAAARHRIALTVTVAPFDQAFQQAIDPASELYRTPSDAILLMLDHRWYGFTTRSPGEGDRVSRAVGQLTELLESIQAHAAFPIIIETVPMPASPLFGSLDRCLPGTDRDVDSLNAAIAALARDKGHLLLDVAALCETVGAARFHDPVAWNLYKLPMASRVVPLYADWLGRLLGAVRGTSRKCLVLDLDNTLWGGVIGDDGLEGLRIGPGSAEGEAFLEVQRLALELKRRGVILAVCSKNEEATARSVFREHPEMLLRETDISVFQANWLDKASNIEAISQALEIGLDSLVLLDDNAAECAQVRAALPAVAVPELGHDSAQYPSILTAAGYFEAVAFSAEDRTRAESYAANASRAAVRAKSRDLGDYLASLDMAIGHAAFDALNRPRIAQLINKSNQFNLTSRRYSEAEVAAIEANPTRHTFQTKLRDRFGDFGLIGVMIADALSDGSWHIDTWLMSCRVLGRKVEWSMLSALMSAAALDNVARVTASYLPTTKNSMVADHYDRLGFHQTGEDSNGARHYALSRADFVPPPLPFAKR